MEEKGGGEGRGGEGREGSVGYGSSWLQCRARESLHCRELSGIDDSRLKI